MKKLPMVSVCMITYGHENFIEQAINSVLMQQTDFDIELIVANDCSPDNTDIVIQRILKENPKASFVRYIKHEKNIGMMPNFLTTINQCKGKYIALCEGDDYWTDHFKLQKQVDLLENNLESIGCYHRVEILNETLKEINYSHIYNEPIANASTIDILKCHFIPTLSLVFRNDKALVFPKWFSESPVGDIPLELLLSLKGNFKFLEDTMGVYRYSDKGVSSDNDRKMNLIFYRFIKMYSSFNSQTEKKFDDTIFEVIYQRMRWLKRANQYLLIFKSFRFVNLNSLSKMKKLLLLLVVKNGH